MRMGRKEDFMYIKLYVTEEEKAQLEKIAMQRKLSLSRLCYEQMIPLLHNSLSDATPAPITQKRSKNYTHVTSLHLSDSEYTMLTQKAGGTPLSKYIRNVILYQCEPIRIEVYTEDIAALSIKVSGYIEQLHNFIAALAIRRQLYEADYERLIQIVNDTKTALKEAASAVKANRSSIRASGVRILRKEIQKAVESLQSAGGVTHDRHL